MTPSRTPRKRSPPRRKWLWIGVAILLVLAIGLLVDSRMNQPPPPTPAADAATAQPPAPPPSAPVYTARHIYSDTANPKADIAAALKQAKSDHKRVILDFGGDWCGDCQVLDIYFHQPPNSALLENNFVLVHVWIGHEDANLDVAGKYGVPVTKGVPALAVLDANGKTLYAQQTGQFRDMRHMESSSVTEFLDRWKS